MRSAIYPAKGDGEVRRNRLISATLVFVLTAQLGEVSPVEAAYAGACASGNHGPQTYHGYLRRTRPGQDNTYFISVIAEFTVRAMNICDPAGTGPGQYDSAYFVAAANIQSTQGLVQIGYGKCYSDGATAGIGCGINPVIPADGKIHVMYTPDDQSSPFGKLGDGSALAQYNKTLTVGHTYRVRIRAIDTQTDGSGKWEYCIRDKTAGEASYDCWHGDRHWNSSKEVWWGYETANSNSQFGSAYPASNDVNMRWMQYQYRNGGTVNPNFYVVTNLSTTDCLDIKPNPGDAWPNWYHCDVVSTVDVNGDGSVNDYETIVGHTHDHVAP
jgi:hypothetical protein